MESGLPASFAVEMSGLPRTKETGLQLICWSKLKMGCSTFDNVGADEEVLCSDDG
jgi:hypothetical protein